MTLEDIIIPLSIATQNEEKLDAMAAALQEMASQQFDNIAELERNLGGVGKAAGSVKAAQDAMIKQAKQTAEAQKKVADSVAGIGKKTAGVKSLGASFKSMGKNLVDVKGFANKVGESLEQVVASMGPLALALKVLQGIGDAIAGGFSASLAAVDSFNKEVKTFSGMLGSEDLGKALAEDMRAFGQETLFLQEALTNAAARLAKIGSLL